MARQRSGADPVTLGAFLDRLASTLCRVLRRLGTRACRGPAALRRARQTRPAREIAPTWTSRSCAASGMWANASRTDDTQLQPRRRLATGACGRRHPLPEHSVKEPNYGLLDFAAEICKTRLPRCHRCSISSACPYAQQAVAKDSVS